MWKLDYMNFRTNETQIPMEYFFFIVDFALVPRAWFALIVAAKRLQLLPLFSVPTHVSVKFTFLWSSGSWTSRNSSLVLVEKGGGSFWYFTSRTCFDQGANISTDMKKGAQGAYLRGWTGHGVPAGHLLRADCRDRQERLTFVG